MLSRFKASQAGDSYAMDSVHSPLNRKSTAEAGIRKAFRKMQITLKNTQFDQVRSGVLLLLLLLQAASARVTVCP